MRFSARLFISFVFIFLISLLISSNTFAQTLPAAGSAQTNPNISSNTNPDVANNLHNWTQNVMIETMSSLICQLAGVDPVNPNAQCLGVDHETGKIGFVQNGGGAIGLMGNAITMLYTPPLHTKDYFQNLAGNFGLVKPTRAATTTTGFNSLSPILNIWSTMRDIVYLLFVVIFISIGVAIMLRVKIDPRTVMTIQNQIPKIIIGLILVTFSFAIAGFLIDIMYASIYLIFGVLSSIPKSNLEGLTPAILQGKNALEAANGLNPSWGGVFGLSINLSQSALGPIYSFLGIGGVFGGVIDNSILNYFIHVLSGGIGLFVGLQVKSPSILGTDLGFLAGTPLAIATAIATEAGLRFFIPNLIAFLVVIIALLFALFRLWFALISAYIFFLLDVITAPFWIFAGLIPGASISFGLWLRDIVSNLAAFPVAIVMFLLGRLFIEAFGDTQVAGQFVPPFIGNPGSTHAIGALIGFGFILLTPNVVVMVKSALKAPKFDTTPIRQALGAGGSVTTGTARETIASTSEYVRGNVLARGAEKGSGALISRIFGKL